VLCGIFYVFMKPSTLIPENHLDRDEFIGGIVIFFFGGVTVLLSLKMPIGTFRMAGTGLFPLCLGILLMILSGLFILKLFYGKKTSSAKEKTVAELLRSSRQVILFLGVMVLATLTFNTLGYPLTAFLLMAFLLRTLGIKRWIFNLSLSLATSMASYVLFVLWLKIPLPKGWMGL